MLPRYRTRIDVVTLPPTVLKATGADTSALTWTTVLTTPIVDKAGDYVEPEGGDYSPHMADGGVIDLEHRRHPHFKSLPIASAYDSLWEPGGKYCVWLKALNFAPDGEPDDVHTVPIGREHYDRNLRHSMQAFAMREQGALPGSSLEFEPDWAFCKSLGRSPLENRDAYNFGKYRVHRWTACAIPVNDGALVGKAIPSEQVPHEHRIFTDRRILVGANYEPLCPLILKAFALDDPRRTKRTTVRVETKAMPKPAPAPVEDDEEETDDVVPDVADTGDDDADLTTANDDAAGDDGGMPSNGVSAFYKHAETLEMLLDELEQDLEATDSPNLYTDGQKLVAEGRAFAAKVKGSGDKHDAKNQAVRGKGSEPPDEDVDPKTVDMSKDDDGVFKSIRRVYKAIRPGTPPKRFPSAALQPDDAPAPVKKAAEPDPNVIDALAGFRKLKQRLTN
jgi:hypothetical protein